MVHILHLEESSDVQFSASFFFFFFSSSPWTAGIPLSDMHEAPYYHEHFVHVDGVLRTIVHLLSWFAGVIAISTVFWLQ